MVKRVNKITFTPDELEEYYQGRTKDEDRKEKARGRFGFNTMAVLATLGALIFIFL